MKSILKFIIFLILIFYFSNNVVLCFDGCGFSSVEDKLLCFNALFNETLGRFPSEMDKNASLSISENFFTEQEIKDYIVSLIYCGYSLTDYTNL